MRHGNGRKAVRLPHEHVHKISDCRRTYLSITVALVGIYYQTLWCTFVNNTQHEQAPCISPAAILPGSRQGERTPRRSRGQPYEQRRDPAQRPALFALVPEVENGEKPGMGSPMNYLSRTRARINLILPAAVVDLIIRDSCHLDPTHTAFTR